MAGQTGSDELEGVLRTVGYNTFVAYFLVSMNKQSDQPASGKPRPRIIRIVVSTVGVLFVFYVLSEGLAYRLFRKDVISHGTFLAFYSPIMKVSEHYKWCDSLEYRYENLWYSDGKEIFDYLTELKANRYITVKSRILQHKHELHGDYYALSFEVLEPKDLAGYYGIAVTRRGDLITNVDGAEYQIGMNIADSRFLLKHRPRPSDYEVSAPTSTNDDFLEMARRVTPDAPPPEKLLR
jgi:hypothetical protein